MVGILFHATIRIESTYYHALMGGLLPLMAWLIILLEFIVRNNNFGDPGWLTLEIVKVSDLKILVMAAYVLNLLINTFTSRGKVRSFIAYLQRVLRVNHAQ